MEKLEEKFKNIHSLERAERIELIRELKILRPDFLKSYAPDWWWWKRCTVNVLIVCDGKIDFGFLDFGLSEFLTAFQQLKDTTWFDYKVTLAHRGNSTDIYNKEFVVNKIQKDFHFVKDVDLNDFDQVWLFGFESHTKHDLKPDEKEAIESYMNGGGGIFATGDHGNLGRSMCGDIVRIKDMRYWNDFPPNSSKNENEVSMNGRRRNDTNRPTEHDYDFVNSRYFDNQSDNIPQKIDAQQFGSGIPHPLLSINKSWRSSEIINVLPDHPHEGECKPETSFTVNGETISTQIIATSSVPSGNTTNEGAGKELTISHSFPCISVWDGRRANVGRIVVDSTFHHFVNINLDGNIHKYDKGNKQDGLDYNDFVAIRQYYMNISLWMSRRTLVPCWRRLEIFDLYNNAQLVEATLNNPNQNLQEISLADLNSIGSLAEEILASKYTPAFARTFLLEIMEDYNKDLAAELDVWKQKSTEKEDVYYQNWLNLDLILFTSIGAGFIALRDDEDFSSEKMEERHLEKIFDVFLEGINFGFDRSISNLNQTFKSFSEKMRKDKK